MFCWKCGTENDENNFKCTSCGVALREVAKKAPTAPRTAPPKSDGTLGGLIPKNSKAVAAYYLGIFSLVPFFGFILGIIAFIMGIMGLNHAEKHPESKGKAHSWVGIILGALVVIGHILVLALAVASAS